MSAQRASNAATTASADHALAHVRIPGSDRTFQVRDVLRGMGLRWDPLSHAWHGTLPAEKGALLGRKYGLQPQIVPTIEAFDSDGASSLPETPPQPPVGPRPPIRPRNPRDGSRTCAEARLAFPGEDDPDEVEIGDRRFSLLEITSGLPDDSREADERAAERQLRDLRARVKAARAVVANTPGLAVTLGCNWPKAARFYARSGITEEMLQYGVDVFPFMEGNLSVSRPTQGDRQTSEAAAKYALLPGPEPSRCPLR